MKKHGQPTEAEIGRAVVAELQREGFETYEEVGLGARADVVGLRGPVLIVVECKVSMGLAVLEQCFGWLGQAHMVIAATAYSRPNRVAQRFMKSEGIGHWVATWGDTDRGYEFAIQRGRYTHHIEPRLFRRAATRRLRDLCVPETKSGSAVCAAGTNQGGHWTPFRATCALLLQIAKDDPGIELRKALAQVKHHYASTSSAMGSLSVLIRAGHVKGVRCEYDGRHLKLFAAENAAVSA